MVGLVCPPPTHTHSLKDKHMLKINLNIKHQAKIFFAENKRIIPRLLLYI